MIFHFKIFINPSKNPSILIQFPLHPIPSMILAEVLSTSNGKNLRSKKNIMFNLMAHCIVMRHKRLQYCVRLSLPYARLCCQYRVLEIGDFNYGTRMEFAFHIRRVSYQGAFLCLWCNYFCFTLLINIGMCVITDKKLVAIEAAFLFNHFSASNDENLFIFLPSISPSLGDKWVTFPSFLPKGNNLISIFWSVKQEYFRIECDKITTTRK